MKKIFIGIDQSFSHSGVSVIDEEGKLIQAISIMTDPDFFKFYADTEEYKTTRAYDIGLVDDEMKITKKKKDLTKEEKEILTVSKQKRINRICNSLEGIFSDYQGNSINVAIESISMASSGAIVDLARLLGSIERTCQTFGAQHVLFAPTQVKAFAGKGNYGKEEMIQAVKPEDLQKLIACCPVNSKGEAKGLDNLADSYHLAGLAKKHFQS